MRDWVSCLVAVAVLVVLLCAPAGADRWMIGKPIVTYWAGPAMTDATAQQMAQGNWNVVWCTEEELDVVLSHGLRAQLQNGLLDPATLDDAAKKAELDALIDRVKSHPALYSYFLRDEPNTAAFPGLARLVAYLRERDPAHLAYINLFPTNARTEDLGTQGDVVTAYREYLRQYIDIVQPDLISYDHYHWAVGGLDNDQYFLNLAMIRRCALDAGLPFLNIVQACTWTPAMRVPNGSEVRWLVWTSLAYGAQGISYYVYCYPGHRGAVANADGTPTELYYALRTINRDFAAIAGELQPLRSIGAYHLGMVPDGAEALPGGFPFHLEPAPPAKDYAPPAPIEGMVIGAFGPAKGKPTHVVVVNLDYKQSATTILVGPGPLQVFGPGTGKWRPAQGDRIKLRLPPGGGRLVRVAPR